MPVETGHTPPFLSPQSVAVTRGGNLHLRTVPPRRAPTLTRECALNSVQGFPPGNHIPSSRKDNSPEYHTGSGD